MNKKGVELTLNTIIIAVIAVIALIVVVTFFLGGFSKITSTISSQFYPLTSGTDRTIAIQTCQQRCDQARLLPHSLRAKSAYCTSPFKIDTNNDGEADKMTISGNEEYVKFFCNKDILSQGEEKLEVSCLVKDDTGNEIQLGNLCS